MTHLLNSAIASFMAAKEIAACPALARFLRDNEEKLTVRTVKTYIKHGIIVPYKLMADRYGSDYFHVASIAVRYKVWREWALQRRQRHAPKLTKPDAGKLLGELFGNSLEDPDGKPVVQGRSLREYIDTTFGRTEQIPLTDLTNFVDDVVTKLRNAGRI